MPAYNSNPLTAPAPILLVAGKPTYLLGSFDDKRGPMRANVTAVARSSSVATVTLTIVSGNIPAVGDLISIVGTASAGGVFNVTNTALTGVNIALATGQGTVTFAIGAGTLATTPDNGIAEVLVPEVGEALNNGSSVPCTLSFNDPNTTGARTVTVQVTNSANSLSGSPVWAIQGSLVNIDSEYVNLNTPVAITTSAATNLTELLLNQARFYRITVSGATGGPSGTITAKVEV